MDERELKRQVKMQAVIHPGLKKDEINEALDYTIQNKPDVYPSDVGSTINLAYRFKNFKNKNSTNEYKPMSVNLSPHNLMTSEYFVEKVTPYVEQVRKKVFGNKKPPFDSIKKAVSWIEKKAKEPLPLDIEKRIERLHNKLQEAYDQLTKNPVPWTISSHYETLDYPGDGYVKRVPAIHPELHRIKEATDIIEKATGFERYSVTLFILTGISPILPRIKTYWNNVMQKLPTGEVLNRFNITLEINSKDLRFEDLREAYNSLRNHLRVVKKKPLNRNHERLFQRVKELGGSPKKGSTAFWKKIAKELNYGGPKQAYTSYNRIIKKLEGQSASLYQTHL